MCSNELTVCLITPKADLLWVRMMGETDRAGDEQFFFSSASILTSEQITSELCNSLTNTNLSHFSATDCFHMPTKMVTTSQPYLLRQS